jgi:hypothetical protein
LIVGFIDEQRAKHRAVGSICKALREQGVPVAARTYRAWKHAGPSVRDLADAVVIDVLRAKVGKPEGMYGRRKMTAHLRREGFSVSKRQVDRLMRQAGGPLETAAEARGVLLPATTLQANGIKPTTAGATSEASLAEYLKANSKDNFTYVPAACGNAVGWFEYKDRDNATYKGWTTDKIFSQQSTASAIPQILWFQGLRVFADQAAAENFMQETASWYSACANMTEKFPAPNAATVPSTFRSTPVNLGVESAVYIEVQRQYGTAVQYTFQGTLRRGNVVHIVTYWDGKGKAGQLSSIDLALLSAASAKLQSPG